MRLKARSVWWSFVAAAVLAAGCNRSESNQKPMPEAKPPAQEATQPPSLPPGHPPVNAPNLPAGHPPIDMSKQSLPPGAVAEAPNPQWTVPMDWQVGNPAPMRRATFLVKGADGQSAEISVSAFPGDVGGLLANINRWRGQIGLGPVAPDEVAALTSDMEINGAKVTVVDFRGHSPPAGKAQPQRMIVVTIPHTGDSWFFKMTGDAPLVETQKEKLMQFVESVRF